MNLTLNAATTTMQLTLAPFFKGAKGEDGEFGGAAGDEQSFTSSTTWTIDHALPRTPHVAVKDAAGRALSCSIDHVSTTRVTVTHNSPQSGTMRIS